MTWIAWRTLHPDTLALSSATGFSRDYRSYPYVRGGLDYRTNDSDTFSVTRPAPDSQFENKDMVFGVTVNGEFEAYVWERLRDRVGDDQGVIADEVGGAAIAVVFHLSSRYVHAFERNVGGELIDLELQPR
jgi:hypothetical protein